MKAGRRFKSTRQFDLDEETIDDSVPDRRQVEEERDDDRASYRYDEDADYPRRQSNRQVFDLPRTPPHVARKGYKSSDEIPIPPIPVIDTSSVPLPSYDHRLPRSLEFEDYAHPFNEEYPMSMPMPRGRYLRRHSAYPGVGPGRRAKSWSRTYWRKFSPDFEPNQSVHRSPLIQSASDEAMDTTHGLDGYLEGLYGNTVQAAPRSSLKHHFPLTMDQLPLLDPQPALDKTLMESFLSTNQRLASLLAPESFNPNFSEDQASTSSSAASSSESSSSSSGGGGGGGGGGSFRSLIPFGFSLGSLFGNSRYSVKGNDRSAGQSNDEDGDDESGSHGATSDSCDSNDSSDSRNSFNIADPPPASAAVPTASSTPPPPLPSLPAPQSTTLPGLATRPSTSTFAPVASETSEALGAKQSSMRRRIGVVRSAAM